MTTFKPQSGILAMLVQGQMDVTQCSTIFIEKYSNFYVGIKHFPKRGGKV